MSEGKAGAVVSFLAILQLCKEQLIGIAANNGKGDLNVFLLTENTADKIALSEGERHE